MKISVPIIKPAKFNFLAIFALFFASESRPVLNCSLALTENINAGIPNQQKQHNKLKIEKST